MKNGAANKKPADENRRREIAFLIDAVVRLRDYSHSMVAGGLVVMS